MGDIVNWQGVVVIAALTSAVVGLFTIRFSRRSKLGSDSEIKVQKLHCHTVPRLGGIPVMFGFTAAGTIAVIFGAGLTATSFALAWLTLLPAFLVGLLEDLWGGRVGVWKRLLTTMFAAGVGYILLGARVSRLDIPEVDALLGGSMTLSFLLTLLAGAGIPHAINIIDGCNGLASFIAMTAMVGLGVASLYVADYEIAVLSFSGAGAIFGFLLWNFPFGKLFLGDSGAYFSGFMIAELSMLLVGRHPTISAWFPFILVVYPVWETLYSSFRRALENPKLVMRPDARHLHQLIFKRIFRPMMNAKMDGNMILANSASSLAFWAWAIIGGSLALEFRSNALVLQVITLIFVFTYLLAYGRLARSRMQFRSWEPYRDDDISADALATSSSSRKPTEVEV